MFELNASFIAGVMFAIFCSYMLIYSLRSYKKSVASNNWPSTEGNMSKVVLWGTRNIDGQMKESEKLRVEYDFEIDHKKYNGEKIAFYTLVYPETVTFAESHPLNSSIKVYYNPNNPNESVLIPGPRSGNKRYSDIILAGIGFMLSISIAFFGAIGKIG